MNKLNEIIHKRFPREFDEPDATNEFTLKEVKQLMLDAMRQVLEEAAENAEITERRVSYKCSSGVEFGYVNKVNKQSITDTINKYL